MQSAIYCYDKAVNTSNQTDSGIVSKLLHISVKLFPPSGRAMILVFERYHSYEILRVTHPLSGGVSGWKNLCNFRQKSTLISSETVATR